MQVGDTVSLRLRADTGPTEVVGTVLAASADVLTVRRRDGSVVDLDVTRITASRVVPPSPAQRISAAELQRIMAGGWRALDVEPLGDWLLRAGGGFTGRGNSALGVGAPGLPLDAAIDRVEQWYAARALPARFQVPDRDATAGLPAALADRGWLQSAPTQVMTAELGPVLRANRADPGIEVRLDDGPDAAWLVAYRADEPPIGSAAAAVQPLLTNHPTVVFASVREGERCTAIARAAVDARWVGLFCVEVAPDRRRTGLAAAVSVEALRWAVSRGGRHAYLQVTGDNTAARSLYTRMGFVVHHDYAYWTRSV